MKKVISTIVSVAIITTLTVNTASAGNRGVDPIWIPVAIFSTLAAAVAFTQPTTVHEQRVVYETRPTNRVIVYEQPHHEHEHRHVRHYEHDREYEEERYRERVYRYQKF